VSAGRGGTALSQAEIGRFGVLLRARLAELVAETEAVQRDVLEPSGRERFQDVDESIEEAGLAAELDVLASEDELGYELREALERIAQGTFGRCEECQAWIPRERLELVPEARLCVPCAQVEA
jgi:RNA polymerase-binding transcription factor